MTSIKHEVVTNIDGLTQRAIDYWHPVLHLIGSTPITDVDIKEVRPVDGEDSSIIVGTVGHHRPTPIQLTVSNGGTRLGIRLHINHEREIEWLRTSAAVLEEGGSVKEVRRAIRMRAAASLLEVHDSGGLNLTNFGDVDTFVNLLLDDNGFPPVANNHR
jgi:hypothetical protein